MGSFYEIDGRQYPRVTSILGIIAKPQLLYWYGKNGTAKCKAIISESQEIGTRVHKYIENILRSGQLDLENETNANVVKALMAFQDWRKSNRLEPEKLEYTVYSRKHGYAGTMDYLGLCNNKLVIMDWKTSNAIYPESRLQVAAYAKAVNEMDGRRVKKGVICRFDKKNGSFEVAEYDNLSELFSIFLHAKSLWEWEREAKHG